MPSDNHKKSDFLKFIGTPFERYILPVIPAGTKDKPTPLSKGCHIETGNLGKIPGSFNETYLVWSGFHGWQTYEGLEGHLRAYDRWQGSDKADTAIAVALQLNMAVAIDIDNMVLADKAQAVCTAALGHEPYCVRRRDGSARRVLIYFRPARVMPITKSRTTFTHPLSGDEVNAIEVLGKGQHVVIEGPHSKGDMQIWENGKGLVPFDVVAAAKNNLITVEDVGRMHLAISDWMKEDGGKITIIVRGGTEHDYSREAVEIVSTDNTFWIHDPAEIKELAVAMRAIDLNDERIDYYIFINLLRALCTASGESIEFLRDEVWPWACTQTVPRTSGMCTSERGISGSSPYGVGSRRACWGLTTLSA